MDNFVFFLVIALCGTCASSLTVDGPQRIIGGLPAVGNQFPFMISLQRERYNQGNYILEHKCGGALVTLQHAVTTASCTYEGLVWPINPSSYLVFAGSPNLVVDYNYMRSITNIIRHPRWYSHQPYINDIAVLVLHDPFPESVATVPLNLAITNPGVIDLNACTVSGWGGLTANANMSNTLMFARMTIHDQSVCRTYYGNLAANPLSVDENMICAWSAPISYSGCDGDFGNPLVCNDRLTGLLLRSNNCVPSLTPDVYTRVSNYNEWINEVADIGSGASTFQPGMAVLAIFAVVKITTLNLFS